MKNKTEIWRRKKVLGPYNWHLAATHCILVVSFAQTNSTQVFFWNELTCPVPSQVIKSHPLTNPAGFQLLWLRSTLIMSQTAAVLQPSELQISHGPIKTLSLSLRRADVPGLRRVNEWAQGPPYARVMSPAPLKLSHVLRRGRHWAGHYNIHEGQSKALGCSPPVDV